MMHRLLYMQEILPEIFDHCCERVPHRPRGKKNLAALARTCKTFREPALDVLWSELNDLTPLVIGCVPEASYKNSDGGYALKRPLEGTDWDIILGFTRRVRVGSLASPCGLTAECVEELSKPPPSIGSIFPKLFRLEICSPEKKYVPFLRHFAGPRLTVLKLQFTQDLRDAIDVFNGERCPNLTTFIYSSSSVVEPLLDRLSGLVCQWPKLRSVHCAGIRFNAAALTHLSHIPELNCLSFRLRDAEVDRIQSGLSALTFPAIVHYELFALSSATVCRFFSNLCLPSIETLYVRSRIRPTALELKSLLAALPDACNHKSLIKVFIGPYFRFQRVLPPYHIDFHHLCSLTVFANIRIIHLEIPCGVDLSERELLQLASSWPRLEVFIVGGNEGCTVSSAITPKEFVQLLERCRSLRRFSFPFDTHGYTEIPRGHPWHGLEMPEDTAIDVRHSVIEEESIEALAVFFHVAPFPRFCLRLGLDEYRWRNIEGLPEPLQLYHERWERVYSLARKLWEETRNSW